MKRHKPCFRFQVGLWILILYFLAAGASDAASMSPIDVTGFNRDVVIENTASGPPYTNYAMEFNQGEGRAYYQRGLAGYTNGLPQSGWFTNAADGTVFQLQPYTASNILVLYTNGVDTGTLTLSTPAQYSRIAILANSGSGQSVGQATVILTFSDGSQFVTNYYAPDWFNNNSTTNDTVALQGVDRINLTTGAADGGSGGNPRFYQTTIPLFTLGASNKPLASLTLGMPASTRSTGIYAVSGLPTADVLPPVVTNAAATGIQAVAATLNGQVTDTGGEPPMVTLYYGPVDGGANAADWSNHLTLGYQTGAFSQSISGLNPNTTYYFTAQAANAGGTVWAAPSGTFTTAALTLPVVTNLPASNVLGTAATLNGQVLNTGGETPTVTLFYGTSDGGTNPAAWSSGIPLGPQSGTFAQMVSGLAASTTYYFTAAASNNVGIAWATPSRSFTTLSNATVISFFGNGTNWTINQTGLSSANISGNVFHGTDGNGGEAITAWYDGLVNINGFVASFTYQDVGGSPGNNADGLSFDLQESGPTYIGAAGGSLGVGGLVPSVNWELNLYAPNGIGIACHTNGATLGYVPTDPVNVSSGDPIHFTIAYAPWGAVQETLADAVTGASFTTNYNLGDITALLGSSFAYIGFSATDGGVASVQTVSNFTFQVESNGFAPAVVTNLPANDIQPASVTLNGQVLSSGGVAPTITFYYGPADGGTDAASWANSSVLGVETGTFSQVISGLSPATTYYYTVSASNFGGTSWASPSRSFATTAATLPQVANAPATAIGATLATLNGKVLSTGGVPTTVMLYYGPADGGTNAANWGDNLSLGVQGGSYAQTVSDLSSNTTYYFTAEATNLQGAVWATPSQVFTTVSSNPVFSAVAVLTQHNDNNRSGDNLQETALNIHNVNTNQFGLLYTLPVDDQIYAQPLVMTNVNILGRGTHNIVIVATVNDTIYAYDADDPAAVAPYWTRSFINPPDIVPPNNTDESAIGACGGGYHDFTGNFGIVGTPVIDPNTQTLYVVVRTKEFDTNFVQRLHALDLATGLDRSNSPVVIAATFPGSGAGSSGGVIPFDPLRENQRPGLTLAKGMVYVTWASHCDNGPYHGWVIGYNATNLQQEAVWNDTPNGSEAGIWMSGQAPAADTNGSIFLTTGNGTVDATDYGESFLKLTPTNGTMNVASFFIPYDWSFLNATDVDLGCSGMLLIPGTDLAISGGKAGVLYLVNRDDMGGLSSGNADTNIVQSWSLNSSQIHGAPVWWSGASGSFIYVWPQAGNHLRQYQFINGLFDTNAYAVAASIGGNGSPGGVLSISADGTNAGSGIVWAAVNTTANANQSTVTGTLHAYDAQNVSNELWNSDMIPRDALGNLAKFVPPTVANGKVYVATFSDRLDVYGLLPTPPLTINLVQTNCLISWPTNVSSAWTLQFTTNLTSSNWMNVTNYPVLTNGAVQVTIPNRAPVIFYRLQL